MGGRGRRLGQSAEPARDCTPCGHGHDPAPARTLSRDTSGRFLSGNSGGGRRNGARNRLKEAFLATAADHFAEHYKAVFDRLAKDNPEAYARIMSSFIPREPSRDDFASMSDEEVVEAVERAERHRFVQKMIDAGEQKL